MLDTIIQYLPSIILIVIAFLVLLFFFPLAYFLSIVLPFIILREGYRMVIKYMHDQHIMHLMPYVGLLIALILIAWWFLAIKV